MTDLNWLIVFLMTRRSGQITGAVDVARSYQSCGLAKTGGADLGAGKGTGASEKLNV